MTIPFTKPKPVIGMIHVGALPGTPAAAASLSSIIEAAAVEAQVYARAGVHGLIIENMHDTPYPRGATGPEIVAAMTAVARAVVAAAPLPCGIQILAAANREALAVAHAAGLAFIRAEGFAFAHVADEGILQSCAAELLRYRRAIGAEAVQVWADIKKKHSSHAITADVGIGETAHAVEFMRGDAVIVTGAVTGDPPRRADVEEVKAHTSLPVMLGSGVTADNLGDFYPVADGFIVGSAFKRGGVWSAALDPARIDRFMDAYRSC
ncbi:MAG TPA: BtpA/SgcQ family protein [Kiritimatiellia bacterium]|nr:BtpA/SgcQ family protein [Kiritimatiellia bacterium]HMP35397.1 BtpA/SgcQ family protein [Kiritimatiellia bacterium]